MGGDKAISEINKTNEVKVAVHPYNVPFEFGKDTGVQGIGADIAAEIVKDVQAKVNPKARLNWMKMESFDQMLNTVEKEDAQMGISSISVTEERKKRGFLFSQPYYPDSGQIIVARTSQKDIKKLADLAGKKVGVQEDTTGQKFLESQKIPDVSIVKFRTLDDALQKLSGGEVDAVVGDKPIVSYIIFQTQSYRTQLHTVGDLLTREPYAVVTKSPELLKIIDETIARLDREGNLKEIARKHFEDYQNWINKLDQDKKEKERIAGMPRTLNFRLASSSFPMDRLDGYQMHMSGPGGSHTSSHIVTSGRSGSCTIGGVKPGRYQLTLNLIRFNASIDVPADTPKSLTYNINFGPGGANVVLVR